MSKDDVCNTYQFRMNILKEKLVAKRRKVWTFTIRICTLYNNTAVAQIVIMKNTIQLKSKVLIFSKFSKRIKYLKNGIRSFCRKKIKGNVDVNVKKTPLITSLFHFIMRLKTKLLIQLCKVCLELCYSIVV